MNDPFISNRDRRPLSFKITPKMHMEVKLFCLDKDITMQDCVEKALRCYLEDNKLTKAACKKRLQMIN